jgi:predicted nucleic acid-binding Zn ribbon protein
VEPRVVAAASKVCFYGSGEGAEEDYAEDRCTGDRENQRQVALLLLLMLMLLLLLMLMLLMLLLLPILLLLLIQTGSRLICLRARNLKIPSL